MKNHAECRHGFFRVESRAWIYVLCKKMQKSSRLLQLTTARLAEFMCQDPHGNGIVVFMIIV